MKKILHFVFAIVLSGAVCACSGDVASESLSLLKETIAKAENLILETVEGTDKGDIAPGSKAILQTRIDQAYYIMDNTDQEEGYDNARMLLEAAIEAYKSNVVKEGIPHFSLGSKMNLGPSGDWGLEDGFTVEMRVRFSEFASGDQNVISSEGNGGGFMVRNNGSNLQFYINNGGWHGGNCFNMELDTWYHIAATYKAEGAMNFYVDGKLVKTFANCKTLKASAADLQIGTAPSYNNRYMRGDIQHVSIWEDERTEAEVAGDSACDFTGAEEGLMAYWPLELNIGTEITDATGRHIAVLTDVAWLEAE